MPESHNLPSGVTINPVRPDEVELALEFIRGLADYEREPEAVKTTPAQLHEALFGPNPAARASYKRSKNLTPLRATAPGLPASTSPSPTAPK